MGGEKPDINYDLTTSMDKNSGQVKKSSLKYSFSSATEMKYSNEENLELLGDAKAEIDA